MPDKTITIDPEKCDTEGLCVTLCPMRIFTHDDEQVPGISGEEHCVLCGQCVAVCPHDAITHGVLERGRFGAISEMVDVDAEVVSSLLRQRRSVRNYKKKPIPRSELEEIVDIAGFSPTSAHGGEGWTRSCIIVSGEENIGRIRDMTAEYMRRLADLLDSFVVRTMARWRPAPRVGRSLLPDLAMRLARYEEGEDVITYDAPHAIFFHSPEHSVYPQITCDTALYTVMLLAHAKWMGTCWNGWLMKAANGFRVRSFTRLREFLGFPDHHQVFSAATLGYRGVRLHSTPDRRTTARFIGDS
jgi:nitroreductase/NAD-dependent dihydropyrimidine dehydrogenase PreA subunit